MFIDNSIDIACFEGNTTVNIPEYNSDIDMKAYPNLDGSFTNISFFVERESRIEAMLFNLIGEEVRMLHTGISAPGPQTLKANLEGLPAGIYFIRIDLGKSIFTEKIAIN
jgi:hypothetical protein